MADDLNADHPTKADDSAAEKSADRDQKSDSPSPQSDNETKSNWRQRWHSLSRPRKVIISGGGVVILTLIVVAAVPGLRYRLMNIISDASISVRVVDQQTQQPIKGVLVAIDGTEAKTDHQGRAKLNNIDYGPAIFSFSKDAYAPRDISTTVSSSSHILDDIELSPIGIPVTVVAMNLISEEPIAEFTVSNPTLEISAPAGERGFAVVNIPNNSGSEIDLIISSDGYDDKTISINLVDSQGEPLASNEIAQVTAQLTPVGNHFFLSNRSGSINVYRSRVDGSDPTVLVAANGRESGYIPFYTTQDGRYGILISPRKGQLTPSGDLLSELYKIDLDNGEITAIDEDLGYYSVVGMDNDRLVYKLSYFAEVEDRDQLNVYDFDSGSLKTLFASDSISWPTYQSGQVFFNENKYDESYVATSATLIRIDIASRAATVLAAGHTASEIRKGSNPNLVNYSIWNDVNHRNVWYEYAIDSSQTRELIQVPSSVAYKFAYPSPDKNRNAWVEIRDGQGKVIIADSSGDDSQMLDIDLNVTNILRWLDENYLIVHISRIDLSADYIIHVSTGKYLKITDVYRSTYYYDGWGYSY